MLDKLPTPPPGKTGWPWTESDLIPPLNSDRKIWPRISIITPSFNQGEFIEETIRSILLQNYPNLEYIIIDGNSTDNTIGIIRKYEPWLTYWESKNDNGQSHAINKGYNRCSGELVNWICSDDLLCMNALTRFVTNYYIDNSYCYIGKCLLINKASSQIGTTKSQLTSLKELTDVANHWRKNDSIAQQAVLYPVSAVRQIGGLNENNHFTMDYKLWGELLLHNVIFINIPLEIGMYRWYEGQKTSHTLKVTKSLVQTALELIGRNPDYTSSQRLLCKMNVMKYYFSFLYHHFRSYLGIRRRIFNGI